MHRTIAVNNDTMSSITHIIYSDVADYCILIDCGDYNCLEPILKRLDKPVKMVLLTHGHSDHICGLTDLVKHQPDVEICTTEDGHVEIADSRLNLSYYYGSPFAVTSNYHKRNLHDGDSINLIGIGKIDVIATPGHDTSCLSYRIGNDLFSGDSYIPGIKVFSKFPRGNRTKALESYKMLKEMEDNGAIIHCGHHSYEAFK